MCFMLYISSTYCRTPDIAKYVSSEVDSNRDGYIDENEFRTLVAMTIGKQPSGEPDNNLHDIYVYIIRYVCMCVSKLCSNVVVAADIVEVHDCVFKLGNFSNATSALSNASSTASSNNDSAAYDPSSPEDAETQALISRILTPKRREKIAAAVRIRRQEEEARLRRERGDVDGSSNATSVNTTSDASASDTKQSVESHKRIHLERFPSVEVTTNPYSHASYRLMQ